VRATNKKRVRIRKTCQKNKTFSSLSLSLSPFTLHRESKTTDDKIKKIDCWTGAWKERKVVVVANENEKNISRKFYRGMLCCVVCA
jgi:hypothetical protein